MADNDTPVSPRHVLAATPTTDIDRFSLQNRSARSAPSTMKDSSVNATHIRMPAQPVIMSQPPSLPFAESDNPDVMALRAAISVLQMQRDKSKRDLQTLEKLKQAAIAQPELFAEELAAGRLSQEPNHSDPLSATFESDSSDEEEDMDANAQSVEQDAKFPKFPSAQNVFRAPHINWGRYNIVGKPLDRMHEEQRLKPAQGGTPRGEGSVQIIAAPYSPFTDKLSEQQASIRRRSSNNK